eukprot:m.490431 g.490431  ORF g.490431 m.490431 type:complete len:247 (+) comp28048_c0_seq1:68-808(+)
MAAAASGAIAKVSDVKALLRDASKPLGVIIRLRTLPDRYPGGNADMHLTKFFVLASETSATVLARVTSNWDGTMYQTPEALPPKHPTTSDPAALRQSLAALFQETLVAFEGADQPQLPLRLHGLVHDPRYDSDDYEGPWGEIRLSLHDIGNGDVASLDDAPLLADVCRFTAQPSAPGTKVSNEATVSITDRVLALLVIPDDMEALDDCQAWSHLSATTQSIPRKDDEDDVLPKDIAFSNTPDMPPK